MSEVRTRYTVGREPAIAFQVVGDGDGIDLVFVAPVLTHVELMWEDPTSSRLGLRLSALGRTVRFDRRGAGLSDAIDRPWTLADEVEDVIAVMDAAGVERAAIVGWLAGGPLACLLAATHPERVSALVLDTCSARQTYDHDYEWAPTREQRSALMAAAHAAHGAGDRIAAFAPTWAANPETRAWMGRLERMASGPGTMRRLLEAMNDVDVRGVLPSIRAPTLVVRRRDDARMDRRHSVYVAEHVPNARLVETDGCDSMPWGDHGDEWVDLVGEFVAGAAPPRPATRGLVTLLFTDIVDSTATVARIGDTRWRGLLEQHDTCARRAVGAAGGRVVKHLGDGLFARFDTVPDAVAAAIALAGDSAGLGLQVRAGVHLGDCEFVGDDLAGRTVHEAARVAALAGPGEILLSDVAHGLLAGSPVPTTDCGLHHLKGFARSYRLWSVPSAAMHPSPSPSPPGLHP